MSKATKILFFGIHRPNRSPSQRYRIEQFLPFLAPKNYSYDYDFLLDEQRDKDFYTPKNYFKKLYIVLFSFAKLSFLTFYKVKHYDFVFVQREAFMLGTSFFERQWAKRTRLIYDFDDAIWQLDVSEANKHLAFLKNPDKTKEIIAAAYKVVVGNQYLLDYALQFNKESVLIPTCIDTDEYKPIQSLAKGKQICIGWSGSQTTVKHFEQAVPVLKQLKEKYGDKICFKLIGDGAYYNESLNLKGKAWQRDKEIDELSTIDIGIMPLPYEEWVKGKCALKGLVYMAMAIPAVMENIGANAKIVKHGENGFLANNSEEWFETLDKLIQNKELRSAVGQKSALFIKENFSVENYKQAFLGLFS